MGRRQLLPDRRCTETCWKVQHSALFVQKLSRYMDFRPDASLLNDCRAAARPCRDFCENVVILIVLRLSSNVISRSVASDRVGEAANSAFGTVIPDA